MRYNVVRAFGCVSSHSFWETLGFESYESLVQVSTTCCCSSMVRAKATASGRRYSDPGSIPGGGSKGGPARIDAVSERQTIHEHEFKGDLLSPVGGRRCCAAG